MANQLASEMHITAIHYTQMLWQTSDFCNHLIFSRWVSFLSWFFLLTLYVF